MVNLLKRAKNNDDQAIKQIIDKYMPWVIKESSKYEIQGYDFEDIVQHDILSIIKSIKLYESGNNSFDSFVEETIKLDNRNLSERKMKHNRQIQNVNTLERLENNYLFTVEEQSIAYELANKVNRNIKYYRFISNFKIVNLESTVGV